jgi:hypothetical protein
MNFPQKNNKHINKYMKIEQYAINEIIDPETAQIYLNKSDGNKGRYKRKFIPNSVKDYKENMLNGEWVLTHQGIAFDCNDKLVDGHNRLQAVIETGVTIRMQVTRNLSDDAVKYLDRGRNRTNSDRLQISKRQAEALRFAAKHAFKTNPPTVSQLQQINNSEFGSTLEELILGSPTHKKTITSSPLICGVAYCDMINKDTDYARYQFLSIYHQDYDKMTSIVKAFNKQILVDFVSATNHDDLFARCMWVFDEKNKHKTQTGRLNTTLAKTKFSELFHDSLF